VVYSFSPLEASDTPDYKKKQKKNNNNKKQSVNKIFLIVFFFFYLQSGPWRWWICVKSSKVKGWLPWI
jgi:hypothetical protein